VQRSLWTRELNAELVLLDDAAGRREALALRMRITGTVGVLRLAAERGLIDVPGVVSQLRESVSTSVNR
jgi:predicted nucleic acid-binding protein